MVSRLLPLVLLVAFYAGLTPPLKAEETAAIEQRLEDAVKFLASDELEGRGVGTEGLNQAAEYIAAEFSKAGLKTDLFDGSPFQEFEVTLNAELGPEDKNHLAFIGSGSNTEVAQRIELELGKSFNTLAIGGTGKVEAPLVFVGYGITAKDEDYDDYAGLDVEGKAVVILRKEPQQKNPHSVFGGDKTTRHALFSTKISNAYSHGAAAVILVNDQVGVEDAEQTAERQWNETVDGLVKLRGEFQKLEAPTGEDLQKHREEVRKSVERLQQLDTRLQSDHDQLLDLQGAGTESSHRKLPVFFARRSEVNKLLQSALGKELAELEAAIDEGLTPHSQPLDGWKVDCESNVVFNKAMIKNVAGVLEGEGPLAHETVIVGAHYDHLGKGGPSSLAPWTKEIHNGADDNASGTAALLEIAREIASREQRPARRIVFVAFSGEERGLLGSAYYVKNPPIPLEQTVAMVNMDMVGRLKDNTLIVHGTGTATSFDSLIDELRKKHLFKVTKKKGGFGPSDHASFYGRQIPVFHFFTGSHKDYHRPSDDWDKINLPGMRRVAGMVTDVVDRIAASETRPEYVEIKAASRGTGGRPYLGSIPDFGQEVEGYALMGVTKDSPADNGGMKAGDVIVKFGDNKIAGLEDIDGALRKFKGGDKVKVMVLRDGKEVELTITLGDPK